jgi:nucleotide-binding universal stress UspA family protein
LRGATLIAVHSWNWLPASTWQPANPEHLAAEAERDLAEALRPWQDKYPDVPVWQDVVHDHPAHVLTAYTRRADLVVIGRHGRDAGSAIGGIQHAMFSHAHGPIAIIPDPV